LSLSLSGPTKWFHRWFSSLALSWTISEKSIKKRVVRVDGDGDDGGTLGGVRKLKPTVEVVRQACHGVLRQLHCLKKPDTITILVLYYFL
jgi:hypothetical protein